MPARKHHYVPVFYQKGFADSEGLVWVYDRVLSECKHLHPRVVCRTKDLYAVKTEGQTRDRRIETDILGPIDNTAASHIKKVHSGQRLSLQEVAHLSFFIGVQFTRLPSFAREVAAISERSVNEMLRIQFGSLERAQHALDRLREVTGACPKSDAESMVEFIATKMYRVTATERPFLETMLEQAKFVSDFIFQSNWTLLKSPDRSGFVTSDSPFVSLPPPWLDLANSGVGYGHPGTVNYFPLSREICLEMRFGGHGYRHKSVDRSYVRTVNRNTATTSHRFIIGSSLRQMESLVDDCGTAAINPSERMGLDMIRSNADESLIRYQLKHPSRYFYPSHSEGCLNKA